MKKLIVTILAVFYLGVSSGASVQIHYCMGKLINWGISGDNTDDCSNCGMDKGKSGSCCKDKEHKLKLKESPTASASTYLFNSPIATAPIPTYFRDHAISKTRLEEIYNGTGSLPRTQEAPVFLRNCNFRI